jgi:hypothetical protein
MATAGLFGPSFTDIFGGTIDLSSDTFKAMLLTGFTISATLTDTVHYRPDTGGTEITGAGYTALGTQLTGGTMIYDTATNEVRWSHSNPQWVTASFTAAQMIVYKARGGTSAADEVVYWCDFGGAQTVTAGTFTYTVPATGAIATTIT